MRGMLAFNDTEKKKEAGCQGAVEGVNRHIDHSQVWEVDGAATYGLVFS